MVNRYIAEAQAAAEPTAAADGRPAAPVPFGLTVAPVVPSPKAPPKPAWASAAGNDEFGAWADIAVPAKRGPPVTQRLRLIPPGR